jgi:sulfide:quinone oxidoreductase
MAAGRLGASMEVMPSRSDPHRVVIAGAGVAGLEALVALRSLAGDLVDLTLLAPSTSFSLRAESVTAPFGRSTAAEHDIAAIAADHDARFLHDDLRAVRRHDRQVVTRAGRDLPYDALLVAVGARPHPPYPEALTFRGAEDTGAMRQLLGDLDAGRAARVAFVVPPGASWTLPLYELALLTAERADVLGLDLSLTVVTPETAPVASLGREAAAAVAAALARLGVTVRARRLIQRVQDGALLDVHGTAHARADRVVALPVLSGPRVLGLPHDAEGFIPVDAYGAIRGVPRAYGAGDATTVPVKQGGLAAQQAEVAARRIAHAAGADVVAGPLRAALRAHPAAGPVATWFRTPLGARRAAPSTASEPLWWPPIKVAMPYLGAYLERTGIPVA